MALDKSKLFIECDTCGKKIKYGAEAFHIDGYCGIYHCIKCATEFFGRSRVEETVVDYDLINNCRAKLYTTEFNKNKTDEPVELKLEAVYEDRPYSYTRDGYDYTTDEPVQRVAEGTRPVRVGWKWHVVYNGKVIL